MPGVDLLRLFIVPLNQNDIPYMITGAVAGVVYGQPRLTHDLDLVADLRPEKAKIFLDAFPQAEFYRPPLEIVKLESQRPQRGHFNIIHLATGHKADIFLVGEDELHRWAMARRKSLRLQDIDCWIAPPEYVIIRKLEYYREGGSDKHLKDIAGVLMVSADELNFDELINRIHHLGLDQEWAKAKSLSA